MIWLELLLVINIGLIAINIVLYLSSKKKIRDAEKNLNDAEYKRWQVIHHRYVQKEIEEGKEKVGLTLLHPFIREHGGCKGDKKIWDDSLFMERRRK